jgi:hypothetical protein
VLVQKLKWERERAREAIGTVRRLATVVIPRSQSPRSRTTTPITASSSVRWQPMPG